MRLSTRGRYGLKAMFALALHEGEGPLALCAIAQQQDIPEAYLEQLMAPLRRAALVASSRGAQGGYSLSRAPQEISVGDVLRAMEGPFAPAACVMQDAKPDCCDKAEGCVTRIVWERMRDGINAVMDSMTLADMVADHCRMQERKEADKQ
nr:Rrf2 family transcriptional regulator [Maliibacterium massiliense]